jgi:hypothetical protein
MIITDNTQGTLSMNLHTTCSYDPGSYTGGITVTRRATLARQVEREEQDYEAVYKQVM